jgi:ribosomal protein S18 acetylase RimI-like enzyme
MMKLRPAELRDAAALAALVNAAYRGDSSRHGWTTEADLLDGQRIDEERLREAILTPGNVVLVHGQDLPVHGEAGAHEGDALACVHLERAGAGCYLGMLTVRPGLQGAGLGRRLLEAAEGFALDEWQVESVHMTVIVQRAELIAWYERRGYRDTGERRPFPYGDERFGLPRRDDLEFVVLAKRLPGAGP